MYFCSIFVRNLANWYVAVPQAETMGRMGQLALWIFALNRKNLGAGDVLPVGSNLL